MLGGHLLEVGVPEDRRDVVQDGPDHRGADVRVAHGVGVVQALTQGDQLVHLPLGADGRRLQVVQEGGVDVRLALGRGDRRGHLLDGRGRVDEQGVGRGGELPAFAVTISIVFSMYSSTVCMPWNFVTLRVASRSHPLPVRVPPVSMAGSWESRSGSTSANHGFRSGSAAVSSPERRMTVGIWSAGIGLERHRSIMWHRASLNGSPTVMRIPGSLEQAHGWSTGVLSALTHQLLGAVPTAPGYATWEVRQHPASVAWARGQLPTPHGGLRVQWHHAPGRFDLTVQAPAATSGVIALPHAPAASHVRVGGRLVWNGRSGTGDVKVVDGRVTLTGLDAGTHRVLVTHG